jgi:hypothetical protein
VRGVVRHRYCKLQYADSSPLLALLGGMSAAYESSLPAPQIEGSPIAKAGLSDRARCM